MSHTIKIKLLSYLGPFVLLFAMNLNAQNKFEPGYVILNNNDTIYGQIKDRKDIDLFDKIRLKQENHKTKRYSPYDIKGYKKGIESFESLWYKEETDFFRFDYYSRENYGEMVFLKVVFKGNLISCYAKEYIVDDNDYLDYFELFKRKGETKFERATQGLFGLKKKRLAHYFNDCPDLVNKINNNSIKYPIDVVSYYDQFCGK